MTRPEISVVMGVFNGAESLSATIDSVLLQRDADLEFIVVDDGSDDGSANLLDAIGARDPRIKVIRQPANQGLTVALRDGCAAARGTFIARQDCGDLSLPNRLRRQGEVLRASPDVALLAGGVRYVVDGHQVLEACMNERQLRRGLAAESARAVFGPPHHGASMFRRDAYERAGGYRPEFYFAQDLDLWLRLADLGAVGSLETVVYEAGLDAKSISGRYRREQERLKGLALKCRQARRRGESELPYLERARRVRPNRRRHDPSKGEYFIARLMEPVSHRKAFDYYRKAIAANPFNWKARIRSLQLRFKMLTS